ncbi:hypothetical protein K0504_05290 [Neiella marina]|uniref:RcsF protein n=1 Tax=Neiella holothuriorum TaxID=2870530 RepID=A0ABS7EDN9_9GAMM|nr:Rcs stress response system protein RcsF [Neiella holothuriorum]MBW8190444.1 hypothetical protein [Neiella holothuriorum]
MNKILVIVLSVLVTACAGDYDVSTNLDPQNFKNYFKPSEVVVYSEQTLPENAKRAGAVSGLSCQATPHDVPASNADARTDARIKSANLGANALIIDVCETESDTREPQCVELITCYGRAFVSQTLAQ